MQLIALKNVITAHWVIRPTSRWVLCWLPNLSTMPVFDDRVPMQALWLKILKLETGRSLMLSDSSLSKQP